MTIIFTEIKLLLSLLLPGVSSFLLAKQLQQLRWGGGSLWAINWFQCEGIKEDILFVSMVNCIHIASL